MERLNRHNAKKLLEGRVWSAIFRAVEVNFKFINSCCSQEILYDIHAEVTDHRSIVIWVVPTPVLGAFVIVK